MQWGIAIPGAAAPISSAFDSTGYWEDLPDTPSSSWLGVS